MVPAHDTPRDGVVAGGPLACGRAAVINVPGWYTPIGYYNVTNPSEAFTSLL